MGVLYLIFNEGYTATSGDDWMRPDLCPEGSGWPGCWPAWRRRPEVHGLLALM